MGNLLSKRVQGQENIRKPNILPPLYLNKNQYSVRKASGPWNLVWETLPFIILIPYKLTCWEEGISRVVFILNIQQVDGDKCSGTESNHVLHLYSVSVALYKY